MTKEEWAACERPSRMLEFVADRVSERKLRLFAVACCRRIWHLIRDERSREAVEVAQRFADDLATCEALAAMREVVCTKPLPSDPSEFYPDYAAAHTVKPDVLDAADSAAVSVVQSVSQREPERRAQCALLREIVGDPFQPVMIPPGWLTWNQSTVALLARAVYEAERFGDLPILADALEEAGCTDPVILEHLRGDGPHVRGCWVLDHLVGRG